MKKVRCYQAKIVIKDEGGRVETVKKWSWNHRKKPQAETWIKIGDIFLVGEFCKEFWFIIPRWLEGGE
ncbi:hypothetical protein DRN58_05840 [Thermococci archaeon]|nr:MAG: hypothetical protein DRN58_05840 [Thermococci archaeon]